MKIFIDVGGHYGQTLETVIDPIYNFDIIYCFEPTKICFTKIELIKDERIRAYNCGLLDENKELYINYPGSEAASIFNDHVAYDNVLYTENFEKKELCSFISAADFFRKHIDSEDHVVMKLNCEGSEYAILDSLIRNNEYHKLNNLLIDFDIDKIPSMFHLKSKILSLIEKQKSIHHFPQDTQYGGGSHFGGIKRWLNKTNERDITLGNYCKSISWDIKNIFNKKHHNFYKFQILKRLHPSVVNLYYKKIKRG